MTPLSLPAYWDRLSQHDWAKTNYGTMLELLKLKRVSRVSPGHQTLWTAFYDANGNCELWPARPTMEDA